MSYNAKNYMEQGGEKLVIGGTLEIKEGASVTGLSANPLLAATAEALGGIKAAAAGAGDTVAVKIGADGKGYVPTYPDYELPAATDEALGGIIAADRTPETDTVEAKIGEDNKLYVPAYPDYTLPAATAEAIGGVKLAENQADSTAESVAELLVDFNALLAKLKAAGIMVADETET